MPYRVTVPRPWPKHGTKRSKPCRAQRHDGPAGSCQPSTDVRGQRPCSRPRVVATPAMLLLPRHRHCMLSYATVAAIAPSPLRALSRRRRRYGLPPPPLHKDGTTKEWEGVGTADGNGRESRVATMRRARVAADGDLGARFWILFIYGFICIQWLQFT
jgi:hypothetical protein